MVIVYKIEKNKKYTQLGKKKCFKQQKDISLELLVPAEATIMQSKLLYGGSFVHRRYNWSPTVVVTERTKRRSACMYMYAK